MAPNSRSRACRAPINFHGPYEFVSIQVMEKAMQVIVRICQLTAQYND